MSEQKRLEAIIEKLGSKLPRRLCTHRMRIHATFSDMMVYLFHCAGRATTLHHIWTLSRLLFRNVQMQSRRLQCHTRHMADKPQTCRSGWAYSRVNMGISKCTIAKMRVCKLIRADCIVTRARSFHAEIQPVLSTTIAPQRFKGCGK